MPAPPSRTDSTLVIGLGRFGSAVAATLEACQMVMVNPAWGELIDTVELCPLPERS